MAKIKCHALPARQQYYTTPPLQMANAGFWKFQPIPVIVSACGQSRCRFQFSIAAALFVLA